MRASPSTRFNRMEVVGIFVLPLSTISTASAKAISGRTRSLAGSSSTALAAAPKRGLLSRYQTKAWVSTMYLVAIQIFLARVPLGEFEILVRCKFASGRIAEFTINQLAML